MEKGELEFLQQQGIVFNNVIAKGGFGTIYSVYHVNYKSTFALKSIPMIAFSQSELDCLIALDDPKIVRLYKYFTYKDNCYMLMELCTNDLEKYIKMKKNIDKFEMRKLIQDHSNSKSSISAKRQRFGFQISKYQIHWNKFRRI